MTGDPGVTALDRGLRLSLRARSGSDGPFLQLVERALAEALATGGDVPQILYLSVLHAELIRTAAGSGPPPTTGPPFFPAGADPGGADHETYLRELHTRWTAHTHRHLYATPADMVRAVLPPAPMPGNPHSLARVLRTFVTRLAVADRRTAVTLTALIEDPAEAVAAGCVLVGAARQAHDLDGEAHAWARQRHLLTRMPSWSWPGHRTAHDRGVLAYLRPDHRARFEAAIGVLPFAGGPGSPLLTGLPALEAACRGTYVCHQSLACTADRLAGRRPGTEPALVHDEARRRPAGPGPVAAVISANEQILGGPELPVGDPVYRLHARISARATRARRDAGDLSPEPVPGPLDTARLPAYAEIVRRNAGSPVVAALAGQVRADACAHADREALLILADAGHTDPGPLLDGPAEAWPELTALLFRHRPAEAARRLSAAVRTDWTIAAAMLEHAAAELLAASGPRTALDLHDAVVRAVTCAAPPGADPPSVIDGAYRLSR